MCNKFLIKSYHLSFGILDRKKSVYPHNLNPHAPFSVGSNGVPGEQGDTKQIPVTISSSPSLLEYTVGGASTVS